YDSWGRGYLSQYDVFTIGAGYLDVYAALQSSDVASGSTASPTAVYNSSTGQASLSMSGPVSYGSSITWGSSIIWGNSIVWGQSGVSGNTIIWGSCVNQNQTTVSALSDGEDGEN